MMDTYRVRHAIRDVGAALGPAPGEIDVIAKSFPHIRARDVRHALVELPELRASGHRLVAPRRALRPRRAARRAAPSRRAAPLRGPHLRREPARPHPGRGQLARLPDEPVRQGRRRADGAAQARRPRHPDAVGDGVRARRDRPGRRADASRRRPRPDAPYLDAATAGSTSTPSRTTTRPTFRLIRTAHTLGCFQIESPGQRELVGKFGPETFLDLVIDISLFRPGPVKSDMVTPFLRARQGWDERRLPAPAPGAGAGADRRRRRLPRAGAARSSTR